MKVHSEVEKQAYEDSRLLGYDTVWAGKCKCLPLSWILGVNFILVRKIRSYESQSQNNVTLLFEISVISSNMSTSH
jgi:hypothetical protein